MGNLPQNVENHLQCNTRQIMSGASHILSAVCSFMCAHVVLQVCCDLQSADGHQGGSAGHHHLGHSDRTEKERLPLRELCTLAHLQVCILHSLLKLSLSFCVSHQYVMDTFMLLIIVCCFCSIWMCCKSVYFSSDGAMMGSSLPGWPRTRWASMRLQ